jgi:hypothetical protein
MTVASTFRLDAKVARVTATAGGFDRLLGRRTEEADAFREALRRLGEASVPQPGLGDGRGRGQRGLPS